MINSLRNRLFIWYVISLLLMSLFVILIVHIFVWQGGGLFLFLLFLTLGVLGFIIIFKITKSLTYLSSRMKMITSKNLDERIDNVKSRDEIGELADSFNQLLNRLHDAFKREQQFIADVTHELKTPLATLRSTLEVTLTRKRSSEEYQQIIKDAITETNTISSTLKNVLDLAWSETPAEQKNLKSFSLTSLMEELRETTEKMARRRKITVKGQLLKNIYIYGNKEKIVRTLLNIVENAIKYTPASGKISITLKKENKKAIINIGDSGIGISQKDLPYIFDRFYRGSSVQKIYGSGLGLAIAKAIISSHKGEIKVKSKISQGTVFSIILPLA